MHASWATHTVNVDTVEARTTHVLPRLVVEKYLLSLPVRRVLETLGLVSSWLTLWPSKKLAVNVHLYGWITLQLTKDSLHIVHDVGQINEIIYTICLALRLLLLLLLLLLAIDSLTPIVSSSVATWLLWHLANQILYILQIVEPRYALHVSHELLEILTLCRYLLTVAVVGVLLLILI